MTPDGGSDNLTPLNEKSVLDRNYSQGSKSRLATWSKSWEEDSSERTRAMSVPRRKDILAHLAVSRIGKGFAPRITEHH